MFEHKKILVLGMARSGYEVAKLLSNYDNEIIVTDAKEQDKNHLDELRDLNVTFVLTDKPDSLLDESFDYLVKNPGIRKDHPCVIKAKEMSIPVINEVEVAYNLFEPNIDIIAITGSNGKTTTTTMTYEVMKKAGLSVHLGGNIGYPVSSLVKKAKSGDKLVLEISDHQLVDTDSFHPHVAALLNLSEVHLDFHGTYDVYKACKKKIFKNQTSEDIAILNLESEDVMNLTDDILSTKLYFSSKRKSDCYIEDNYICYKNERVVPLSQIKIKGMHNYENIMAMVSIVKQYNVSNDIICDYLSSFGGVEHRIEYVRELNGIKFYNDSKATNTESTIIALSSFENPTIILLGGLDRGHSFEPLNSYVNNVKLVVTYGETKDRIAKWAHDIGLNVIVNDNLVAATKCAYEHAEAGDVVLLSPACASWDQYDSFEIRGQEFKNVVNSFK